MYVNIHASIVHSVALLRERCGARLKAQP
jgi:hypothetical protein